MRYMTNTAAALPVEHIRRLRALFARVRLYSMYGLTECKRVSYLPPEELDRRPASVGKAIPNCEVFIVDEEGRRAAPGQAGELVIRGPNVMQGYWNAPELTARTFRPGFYPDDRLLYTGDLFRMDADGFLYFLGRKDDMIKTKGERVSPREIENALCAMEGIAEAAVIGVPDEVFGEAVEAFVVLKPGIQITEKSVRKHCAGQLEPFLVPRRVKILSELPRTPNGKVDKKALRIASPVEGESG
jgi:acyl-CoA synthetase (AMP-forming)/AMP-acid ligase II